jgi:hypothetical protein
MKKFRIQGFSLLGLLLLGVSALIAAFIPSNKRFDASRFDKHGTISLQDDNNPGALTCTPTADVPAGQSCNVTAASGTTGSPFSFSNATTIGDI